MVKTHKIRKNKTRKKKYSTRLKKNRYKIKKQIGGKTKKISKKISKIKIPDRFKNIFLSIKNIKNHTVIGLNRWTDNIDFLYVKLYNLTARIELILEKYIDVKCFKLLNMSICESDQKNQIYYAIRLSNAVGAAVCFLKTKVEHSFTVVGRIDINKMKMKILSCNIMNFASTRDCYYTGIEDCRIIYKKYENDDKKLFLVGAQKKYFKSIDDCKTVLKLLELDYITFKVISIKNLWNKSSKKIVTQKNWSGFFYEDKLYFEYFIIPHIILGFPKIEKKEKQEKKDIFLEEKYKTNPVNLPNFTHDGIKMSIRGGSSPILIDEDTYLAAGHTSDLYYPFFYTFEAKPPFKLKGMSTYFMYGSLAFLHFHFPMGMVKIGKKVLVSYGGNDCHVIIIEHKLDEILNSLEEV